MSERDNNASQTKPVRVIGCGAIAREILAICEANGLSHIDLACLPAQWHLYPDRIAPGVKEAIEKAREEGFERIYVAYADCGTGGMLDRVCEEEGVERIAGPHCYSFFAGNDLFDEWDDDIDAFFLTDFLARQFESFIIEPLGLDRHPELRDMYFGNYRKLVYLSQKQDPELQEKARLAAQRLGLEYEYRFTGYGDLTSSLLSA
ncbi:DUF1638 domain-containing protein [Hoeflea poritis]|uniref:DUF1638 domain-containing protein n=1 Tax=Hoeflea poritis TaxID=2993659 RepID=A0ABT4VJ07_9HYPH|nr:DUF1638 domain-containing protein [Hoeflea poritis]MDA4844696.1 DUF1638 domain-containing protein [Hoeflea poritis]